MARRGLQREPSGIIGFSRGTVATLDACPDPEGRLGLGGNPQGAEASLLDARGGHPNGIPTSLDGNQQGDQASLPHFNADDGRLVAAARVGDTVEVACLLSAGANADATDGHGWTALHQAGYMGHVKVVRVLITARANLDATNEDGWTALHWASWCGHVGAVEALLAAGANLRARTSSGWTARDLAARNGQEAVVEKVHAWEIGDGKISQDAAVEKVHVRKIGGGKTGQDAAVENGDGDAKLRRVCIVGGGPVGLMTACILLDDRRRLVQAGRPMPPIKITVYDRRWEEGKITWKGSGKGRRDRNLNRRRQVVTIQSNVWSALPAFVQEALFREKGEDYAEYWPLGPDSPGECGFPRNIPLLYIEDRLLALLQDETVLDDLGVRPEHKPELRASRATKQELESILPVVDHLILADGGRSDTEMLLKEMGVVESVAFAKTPIDEGLVDQVLGIFLNFQDPDLDLTGMLSEKESMAVTVSQNRFLLNHLPGNFGFLNMWLAPDEAVKAVGLRRGANGVDEIVNCNQARPCSYVYRDGDFRCPIHGSTVFGPSLERNGALWTTIRQALKLYGIPLACVKEFARFQLGPYSTRAGFDARGTFDGRSFRVFLLGDAAISVNFRFGRGLNTGLKGALSLARTLTRVMANDRVREADFVEHYGYMMKLQRREVDIRSVRVMREVDIRPNSPSDRLDDDASSTEGFKEKVRGIIDGRSFDKSRLSPDLSQDSQLYRANIDGLDQSFAQNLLRSGAWPTKEAGGAEVEIVKYM